LKFFSEEENILSAHGRANRRVFSKMFAKCRIALELLSTWVRFCGGAVAS
jgi:hypothetical protein